MSFFGHKNNNYLNFKNVPINMAWTIAIVLAALGLSSLLLFLNNSFENSKQGMKIFLVSLTLAMLVVISQMIKLIVEAKASTSNLANLQSLATTTVIITTTVFFIMIGIILVMYTKGIVRNIKEAKEQKMTDTFGEL